MRDAAPPAPASPGLYGPQPNASAMADTDPRKSEPEDEPQPEPVAVAPEPEPDEPDEPVFEVPPAPVVASSAPAGISRPPSADAAEERLIAAGLSRALAADVVGEAVTHGLPFSAPRNMKRLVRAALARRIPTPAGLGPAPRTIAIVGGGGSGKSPAGAHPAAGLAPPRAGAAGGEPRGGGGPGPRPPPPR